MQGIIIYILMHLISYYLLVLLKITVKYLNIYLFVIYDILKLLHFFLKRYRIYVKQTLS